MVISREDILSSRTFFESISVTTAFGYSTWLVDKEVDGKGNFNCNTTKANQDFLEADCYNKLTKIMRTGCLQQLLLSYMCFLLF